MKKLSTIIFAIGLLTFSACNNTKTEENKETKTTAQSNTSLFPKGEKLENGYFTGNAFLTPLLAKDANNEYSIGSVTFEPNARTNWHTHPKGQVLIVTEGEGINQVKGQPVQIIKKGEVVTIPANVEHWHGATATTEMSHIAISNYKGEENVVWLKPVTDEEYATAN